MTHIRTRTKISLLLAGSLVPFLAFAQTATENKSIGKLGTFLQQFILLIDNYLVPLVFAVAFIVFLYGIAQYFVIGGANEEKRDQGKSLMMWGIIGFFVMVSVWGIVNLLVGSFGLGGSNRPDLPTFDSSSAGTAGANPTTGSLPAAAPATTGSLPAGTACNPANCASHVCQSATACLPVGPTNSSGLPAIY